MSLTVEWKKGDVTNEIRFHLSKIYIYIFFIYLEFGLFKKDPRNPSADKIRIEVCFKERRATRFSLDLTMCNMGEDYPKKICGNNKKRKKKIYQ